MQNAGLGKAQAGIKIVGRNINNLRYADGSTLMAESEDAFPGIRFLHLRSGSRFQELPRSEAKCRDDCNATGRQALRRAW